MNLKKMFAIILITISFSNCKNLEKKEKVAKHKNTNDKSQNWKYNTLAHQLLNEEQLVSDKPKSDYVPMYKLLDSVIEYNSIEIKPILSDTSLSKKQRAIKILKKIDISLAEMNFTIKIHTSNLSDALVPTKFNYSKWSSLQGVIHKRGIHRDTFFFHNYLTKNILNKSIVENIDRYLHFEKKRPETYYIVDCDIGALLYLSIAEVNSLNMYLVEVPGHNFVRYYYDDTGNYINWDNNTAKEISNEEYKKGQSFTSNKTLTEQQIKLGRYLQDMSREEVVGYYRTLTAVIAENSGDIISAEKELIKAVKARPYSTLALNNLSWLYITQDKYQEKVYFEKALALSKKVDSIYPMDNNYKDTFACAYASLGDFKMAEKIELQGSKDSTRLAGYRNNKTCYEMEKE